MNKKILYISIVFIVLIIVSFWFLKDINFEQKNEQKILEDTYTLSKEYITLRYETSNLFLEAKNYKYEDWDKNITEKIEEWKNFDEKVYLLEKNAEKFANKEISISPRVKKALAYDKYEATKIFDKAPAGKKIATLARHLGVDAKMAQKVLEQEQNMMSAEAWNEEGDLNRKVEVGATIIKDTSKVVGFVGGIVVTGGTSALLTSSVLAKATVVVSGADMILEITEDGANIALGDNNKISAIASDARKITEPVATILTINEIPNNLKNKFEKFQAVMVGAEQLKGSAQDGKIIGISLPASSKNKEEKIEISNIDEKEINTWIKDQGIKETSKLTQEEIEKILNVNNTTIEETEEENTDKEEIKDEEANTISGKKINLKMKTVPPVNDWQATIKIDLFSNAPIEIADGEFYSEYKNNYTIGSFVGVGSIKIKGTYNEKTGELKGTHYRIYEGTYKGEPRTLIYSGNFNHKIENNQKETKINFNGKIEETRLDGKGKPYTTNSEGGTSIIYEITNK